jgi:hypothetical protein
VLWARKQLVLAYLFSFGCFNKRLHFFIDYHSKIVVYSQFAANPHGVRTSSPLLMQRGDTLPTPANMRPSPPVWGRPSLPHAEGAALADGHLLGSATIQYPFPGPFAYPSPGVNDGTARLAGIMLKYTWPRLCASPTQGVASQAHRLAGTQQQLSHTLPAAPSPSSAAPRPLGQHCLRWGM